MFIKLTNSNTSEVRWAVWHEFCCKFLGE